MRDFAKGAMKFLGGLAVILGVAIAILYFFFVRVVEVGHNAMAPTIMLGDRVVVWRTTDFELGEVVLCAHPEIPGRFVLGRFVGRPGQTIRIERGQLYINGESPDVDLHPPMQFDDAETGRRWEVVWGVENILDHEHYMMYRERSAPRYREREVGPGLFVLSDNRSYRGEDSRDFGVVVQPQCIGRVFMRLTAGDSPEEISNGALDLLD